MFLVVMVVPLELKVLVGISHLNILIKMLIRTVRRFSTAIASKPAQKVDREWYKQYYDEFKKDKSEDKATAIAQVMPQVRELINTVDERTAYILLHPIAKTGKNSGLLDEIFQGYVDKLRTNNYDHG